MARVYGQIGMLTQLVNKLGENGIHYFQTMDDIRVFRHGYKQSLESIKKKHAYFLQQEITNLESLSNKLSYEIENSLKHKLEKLRISFSEDENPQTFFERITLFFKRKIRLQKSRNVLSIISKKNKENSQIKQDIKKLRNNPKQWIATSAFYEIQEQERILSVFKENKKLFYGAENEERTAQELSKLPDTYTVIHDYQLEFQQPIYDRKNDARIYSIQIDHLVIGPTGIYLIETKNWSETPIQNCDLYSSVQQLQRQNLSIYVLLNQAIEDNYVRGFYQLLDNRKISPKSILLFMNHKLNEENKEYEYVQMLSLPEVVRYILNRTSEYNNKEVKSLTNYLVNQTLILRKYLKS